MAQHHVGRPVHCGTEVHLMLYKYLLNKFKKKKRGFTSSPHTVQKWRSILVVGALMMAGCILLLHLNVVDSLTNSQTLEDVQGHLPARPRQLTEVVRDGPEV